MVKAIQSGDRLVARVENEQLIFEKSDTIKQRLKQRFAHLSGQGLVDELIADRRLAAVQEQG